jgi:predicted nucleic acid-binding protein
MENNNLDLLVIADTSFYVLFLKDICKPKYLKIITNNFEFNITPTLIQEVIKKTTIKNFTDQYSCITSINPNYNFNEILRPFFSTKELDDGETEVIGLVYQWYKTIPIHKFILDDGPARKFVERNLSEIKSMMIGTIGFIGDCHCNFYIIKKDEALNLLVDIKRSPFNIKDNIINVVSKRITNCNTIDT